MQAFSTMTIYGFKKKSYAYKWTPIERVYYVTVGWAPQPAGHSI